MAIYTCVSAIWVLYPLLFSLQAEGVAFLLHMLSEPVAGQPLLRGTSNASVESASHPASPLSDNPASPTGWSDAQGTGRYDSKLEGTGLEPLLARVATSGSDTARYAASRAICNLAAWKVGCWTGRACGA